MRSVDSSSRLHRRCPTLGSAAPVAHFAAAQAVTASSAERGNRMRELGAAHVLDRAGEGDPAAPALYDVIIEIVGGPPMPTFIDRLAPNGRLVLVGVVGGLPPADFGMRLMSSFRQSRSIATFSLASPESLGPHRSGHRTDPN